MAKSHKYIFYNRQYDSVEICGSLSNIEIVTVNIFGENKVFKVLECFDFDSYRKRNSVLIEDGEGRIKLYMKGAENVVYKRLTEESKNELWDATSKHIDEFSKKGLRMLLCAYKSITKEKFEEWYQRYKDTKVKGDEEAVEKIVDEMESGLELLGATAVEDQLQDDVPSTLNSLREAGIRVWMLTGDKTQTALNIAKSCSLLTAQMRFFPNIVVVDIDEFKSDDEVYAEVTEKLRRAWDKIKHLEQNSPNQAFVVSGRTLDLFFPKNTQLKIRKMNEMQKMMIQIIQKSRVVVCCRVSPYQKSQLVDLYKLNYPKDITLSIGDGANDVPMLKKANIGVGIIGKEGLQASRASDFSINQFKDLKSLTMYHGAMNCSRIAKKINFYLYKNVFDNFANFLYIFFTGFSNTFLLPQDGLATLNLLLTLMTLFIIGITEKKYSRKNSYRWPFLYKEGPDHKELNFKRVFMLLFCLFYCYLLLCSFCYNVLYYVNYCH
ncbi:Phospholipid-transporting ATPase IA, variant 2, partial [Bonamia ostreae]